MRVLLTHNPGAGYGDHGRESLRSAIERGGHQVTVCAIKADEIVAAADKGVDLVAVGGGDGAVVKVARALRGRDTPLAVLPLGTANNIAGALGCRDLIPDLIARWSRMGVRRFDMGLAKGPKGERRFMESFGIGVFGALIARDDARAKELEKEKKAAKKDTGVGAHHAENKLRESLLALREQALSERAHRIGVDLDGYDWTGQYVMLEVMNLPAIGPRMPLAPSADPADGEFDVALLKPEERGTFAAFLTQLLDGKEPRPGTSGFAVRRAKRLVLTWDGTTAHSDGAACPNDEYVIEGGHGDRAARVEVAVERAAVPMLACVT